MSRLATVGAPPTGRGNPVYRMAASLNVPQNVQLLWDKPFLFSAQQTIPVMFCIESKKPRKFQVLK
jgi:hypothetical protein